MRKVTLRCQLGVSNIADSSLSKNVLIFPLCIQAHPAAQGDYRSTQLGVQKHNSALLPCMHAFYIPIFVFISSLYVPYVLLYNVHPCMIHNLAFSKGYLGKKKKN